ncbi:MAG: hypothetical protein AAGD01_10165 [Acidobacteriota bacterium]
MNLRSPFSCIRRPAMVAAAAVLVLPLAATSVQAADSGEPLELQRRDLVVESSPNELLEQSSVRSDADSPRLAGQPLTAVGAPTKAEPRAVDAPDKATVTLVYDDGVADNGYGAASTATVYEVVQLFQLPRTPLEWDQATLCFSRLGIDSSLDFDLVVYDDDGIAGAPGTLLQSLLATVDGVSTDLAGSYYNFDLSSLGITFSDTTVFIGARWDPSVEQDFFLCSDHSGTGIQPGYSRVGGTGVWGTPPAGDTDYRALMVRGVFSDPVASGPCVADAQTLCLNNNRFRVTTNWRRPDGSEGTGQGVELTDDTGYFWFFRDTNVEVVVKVLDACALNPSRYWVFAGGLTNVEVELVVTDTENPDQPATYLNPLQTQFQPIQDTNAFATCP